MQKESMIKDVRQSPQFAAFMNDIGWQAEKIGPHYIYLRKFPIFGCFAKIPRPNLPMNIRKVREYKKSRKIFRLKISPLITDKSDAYLKYQKQFLACGFKIDRSPFNPTTDYQIDLIPKEDIIFGDFYEAKKRAVRRAWKNNITIMESRDIESFIKIRQQQYLPVWFLVGNEMKKLWKNFHPQNASLLLAYPTIKNDPVAGILLLFYDKTAYYWFASSLPIGKKLFAPTLLVWEAIKLAKKHGCKIFDFEGIYDERFPKASASWKGFTRFKEGFGVKKVVYMENFYI